MLDPVARVAVNHAILDRERRGVNVTTNDPVTTFHPGVTRNRTFEVANVFNGSLDAAFETATEVAVVQRQCSAATIDRIVRPHQPLVRRSAQHR